MKNYMKVSFSAKVENVVFTRTVALGFLVNLDLEIGILNEIKTAISEAITNAIVHGYQNDETKTVDLIMYYDDTKITMEVIDYGIGIENIEKAKTPLFSSKVEEERAGLGFTIMDVFSDELIVESELGKMTKVVMVKNYHESREH
ncbi:MAG: anti-sigma F factor [Bacilli bacterium]|nr:anti-sigma F factor [Bacilli bacterium]